MKLEQIIYSQPPRVQTKYRVTLTGEERSALVALTTSGRAAARTITHARILLKADAGPEGPGWTDAQIREAFEVSLATIVRVRRAFVHQGVAAALHRRQGTTPRPRKMDGEREAHLIALLCGPVPDGHARWTLRLLADQFVELAGGTDISYETVRRVLGKKRAQAVAQGAMVHPTRGQR
jgi:transposase